MIGRWVLALGLVLAGILVFSEPAFAHGGDEGTHAVVDLEASDPDHVEQGHPGHCHGGAFCNGVAMTVAAPVVSALVSTINRRAIPSGQYRMLPVALFDPPPPRAVS
ncbi:hypothetical protein [Ruegeria sp. B32]|uniref:hypothetical protein n=1 Tax=Ruegeria sp. B32 TaxID=2867020 RepID=UPI0021A93403|nr:hypothetical protein [Ruegeria sp. B32]UWR06599.1 hypothetical protein K3752_13235 [Ruegeria sp. B32]